MEHQKTDQTRNSSGNCIALQCENIPRTGSNCFRALYRCRNLHQVTTMPKACRVVLQHTQAKHFFGIKQATRQSQNNATTTTSSKGRTGMLCTIYCIGHRHFPFQIKATHTACPGARSIGKYIGISFRPLLKPVPRVAEILNLLACGDIIKAIG